MLTTLPPLQASSSDSQLSTSTSAALLTRPSTPPSSLSSLDNSPTSIRTSPQNTVSGKKRTAAGQVKDSQTLAQEALRLAAASHHARTSSNISNTSNGSVVELSQQLRTRLTYAMLKVQNGWQNRSLDEVESLASQSPRSTTGFSHAGDALSPRTHLQRKRSNSSSGSDTISSKPVWNGLGVTSPSGRRALAPPANIVAGQRRKPTPNIHLQTGKSLRPMGSQRTPSQNAAMEADAVETLLFMASPNNSGTHPPVFSPITSSAHSNKLNTPLKSPLRSNFGAMDAMISPKKVAFNPNVHGTRPYTQNKNAILEALVDGLDEESNKELDEAVRLMDRHHTAKVSS